MLLFILNFYFFFLLAHINLVIFLLFFFNTGPGWAPLKLFVELGAIYPLNPAKIEFMYRTSAAFKM